MKKNIVFYFFFSFLSASVSLFSQPEHLPIETKDDALMMMIRIQAKVFGKDNLITQTITQEEKDTWTQFLKTLGNYVQAHNNDLVQHYTTIETASNEFITILSNGYTHYIVPALISPTDVQGTRVVTSAHLNATKLDTRALEAELDPLRDISSTLTKTSDALRRLTFKDIDKNDVKIVLETFIMKHLQPLINKALTDFQKVEAFRIKALRSS